MLFSVRFCLQWICTPDGQEEANILSIVERLREYIHCSKYYHEVWGNFKRTLQFETSDNQAEVAIASRNRADMENARRLLAAYEDVVQTSVFNFSPKSSADAISRLAKSLAEELDRMEESEPPMQESKTVWTQQPIPASASQTGNIWEDEQEYVLTDDDLEFLPHSYHQNK